MQWHSAFDLRRKVFFERREPNTESRFRSTTLHLTPYTVRSKKPE